MSIESELIKYEQLANMIFIISTLYAFASADEAAKQEQEKQQDTPPSGSTSTALKSAQFAWCSTFYAVVAYSIYILVGVGRRNKLEQDIKAGTSKLSLAPIIIIVLGLVISLVGAIIRLPAIQQRINEAGEVIL